MAPQQPQQPIIQQPNRHNHHHHHHQPAQQPKPQAASLANPPPVPPNPNVPIDNKPKRKKSGAKDPQAPLKKKVKN